MRKLFIYDKTSPGLPCRSRGKPLINYSFASGIRGILASESVTLSPEKLSSSLGISGAALAFLWRSPAGWRLTLG